MTQPVLRSLTIVGATCLALACSSSPTSPDVVRSATWTANPTTHQRPIVIFVISQGLFFDACVTPTPLPMQGDFQLILNGRTELGPGQVGFLNGRWWEDRNRNGIQDAADEFFFCPIVGLGRVIP